MDYTFIVKALSIGIAVSAPLGPIGVLCIQRTLNKGFYSGFISGVGAATADIVYAVIAGFGISLVKDFLLENQMPIRLVGSVFLAYMGYRIFISNPAKEVRKLRNEGNNFFKDFASSFLVTLSNPITIIAFGAIFAGFDMVGQEATHFHIFLLIVFVFAGALSWWVGLILVVSTFKHKIRLRNILWINRITGILIIIFAVFIAVSAFFPEANEITNIHVKQ
ncbi:MAG: LysE family translocator [Bacteroidota bacterium]|nr:LysE family translocator [Bacteroidota bacterium]